MRPSEFINQLWRTLDRRYTSQMEPYIADLLANKALPSRSQLSTICCEAAGGSAQQCLPLQTAWLLLFHATSLIDNIEDDNLQALHFYGSGHAHPVALDLNISTGLIFLATTALFELERFGNTPAASHAVRWAFNERFLEVCSGQHLDLLLQTAPLETAWEITRAKSGLYMALATWSGARLRTDDAAALRDYYEIGLCIGLLIQISDDLKDLRGDNTEISDIQAANYKSLPIAYAFEVLDEKRQEELAQLLSKALADKQCEKAARHMILDSGAGLYLAIKAQEYATAAAEALSRLTMPDLQREQLAKLIEQLQVARMV